MVHLGEVVRQRKEFITIEPDVAYSRCRVQTSARGVVLRDLVQGSEVKTKRQQVCRAGDFLVAEIDAKVGGYGLVPDELEGAIVSSHYFLYTVDETNLDKGFLNWYCRTKEFLQQVNARGSTNYAAIRSADVLNYRIPLPPPDEQRRMVARLDRVAMLIEEATRLREEVERDVAALTQSLHTALCPDEARPLGDFVYLREDRQAVQPDVLYPQVGIKGFAGGLFTKAPVRGSETSYRWFNRLHDGLLVVSQPKGWEGAIAVCTKNLAGWFVSPEYRTFRCHEGRLTSRYLDMLIRTPWFQNQLAQLSRGQGARRERLRPEMLLAMNTRMPSMDAQATALDVVDRCRTVRGKRTEIEKEFGELLPAMLSEAFGGEVGCSVA